MRAKTFCCALLLALLVPLSLHAQSAGQITGMVQAGDGEPLSGVAITIPGTQLSAVTGTTGRYTISNVPAGTHQVQAEFIGYSPIQHTANVTAGGTAVVNFNLQSRAIGLDEIVVVGYGTQRSQNITGAIENVDADELVQGPARDAGEMLAGRVAGLAIQMPSGNPRSGSEINIRGITSIQGSSSPLILIDGIPGNLETVAAQDIESISVLKDGSAAAIYGTRGSGGVILITTKQHEGGAPTLRYDGYISQQSLYNSPDFLTAADYRALIADGTVAACTETLINDCYTDFGYTTDWRDELLRNPVSQRHNLTMSGGAPNTNYTASLTYEDAQGIFERSENEEITARANIRHSMFDGKLEAEANLISRTETGFIGPSFNAAWRQALIRNPTDRIMDDEGNWQERGGYVYTNPVGSIQEESGEAESRNIRTHGTLRLRPIENLTFELLGGTTRSSSISGSYTTFRHSSNTQGNSGGSAGRSTGSGVDQLLRLTGTYDDLFGDHSVTLLGGYEYQDFMDEGFDVSNSRFPTDLFGYNDVGSGAARLDGQAGLGSDKSSSKLIGFFSRLNYDFADRYLLTGSLRYEGSSRFGEGHKWGLFPGIQAGWRITEEPFMENVDLFDELRFRAGYGVTGIQPNNNYLSLTSYSYGSRFLYNGQWVQSLGPSRNPNPDLKWEEKHELNVGMNFAVLDYRLSGSLDAYRRETRDMLFNYSVPSPPYLTGSLLANVGTMRNSGIEAELSYSVIDRPGLRWTTSVNGSMNSNELVSLSNETFQTGECIYAGGTGEPIQQGTHRSCEGGPIGDFFGYKSVDIDDDGVWIVERPAEYDDDGNLVAPAENISIEDIRSGDADKQVLGNGIPKYFAAWNNTAQVGNFDMSLSMRGAFDFQILNFQEMYYANPTILQYNSLQSAFEPVYGKVPVNYDLAYVSYYIEDGDYWKLDNATIGYTFGENSLGRLGGALSGARFYVTGRNLLTITGYKGMDPEVGFDTNPSGGFSPGNDSRDKYPTTRSFTAGMTVSF